MEKRSWGKYDVLWGRSDCKVKHLIVEPRLGMSFQRHFMREELWFVHDGEIEVRHSPGISPDPEQNYHVKLLKKYDWWYVPVASWHQIINVCDEQAHIIEIQYGKEVVENDIERLFYYEKTPS